MASKAFSDLYSPTVTPIGLCIEGILVIKIPVKFVAY